MFEKEKKEMLLFCFLNRF